MHGSGSINSLLKSNRESLIDFVLVVNRFLSAFRAIFGHTDKIIFVVRIFRSMYVSNIEHEIFMNETLSDSYNVSTYTNISEYIGH